VFTPSCLKANQTTIESYEMVARLARFFIARDLTITVWLAGSAADRPAAGRRPARSALPWPPASAHRLRRAR